MTSTKIHSTHCERAALVYVRQSTWLQVSENRESTERQYHLRQRAIELGWPASRVEVIDEDQGRSGSSATFRTGFQRLAAEVGLGKVGIVLMLEASRLARNNSDWYRLIEICGVSGTLIADESAVYNPREPSRNRDQMLAFFVEVHSVFTPGVEICDQFELLAGPRMKRVSDSETLIQIARIKRS